jgi:hypothetical protein
MIVWSILKNINNVIEEFSSNRRTLLELYRTTLEELRHHERIYTYLVTGMVLIIPILISGYGFLFSGDLLIKPEYINQVKWSLIIILIMLFFFFWVLIFRLERKRRLCTNILKKIETKLKNTSNNFEFEGILIASEFHRKSFDMFVEKNRIFIYIAVNIIAIITLWYGLFHWIK